MFLMHCVFVAAACLVGWIAALGMGVLFQALGMGVLSQAPSDTNPLLVIGLPIAITNCLVAWIACRRISSDGARWVWVPLVLVILHTYTNYPPAHTLGQHLRNIWNQVFSSDCGATECLGQLFLGMPFGGSVIYAATAALVRWDTNQTAGRSGPTRP